MIVTLAGHVDHGKTALVRALTGIDTDRLEEEKTRGLTIELGFAYGTFGGMRIGFVDVPGHHKFVRNMIAGVSNRQFALLVVAADEGPMPQTAEHLDILETLGVTQGIVVMARSDLADETRRVETLSATQALLNDSFLESARVIWCSSQSGEGLRELESVLCAAARSHVSRGADQRLEEQHFRLCIDRSFHLTGAGLVVTGAVHSGRIRQGDRVVSGRLGRSARVRSIRVSDLQADAAGPGDRAALNLTGLDLEQVSRGDWMLAPDARQLADRISLEFRATARLPRPLSRWTSIHLHHGAEHVTGRMVLLNSDQLDATDACLVDCLLDEPLLAKWGDPVLVRDAGSQYTLGGGPVIDTCIAGRREKKSARIGLLEALQEQDPEIALLGALQHKRLISPSAFASLRNIPEVRILDCQSSHQLRRVELDSGRELMLERHAVESQNAVIALIKESHRANPKARGLRIRELGTQADLPAEVLHHVISRLVADKRLGIASGRVFDPEFNAQLGETETALLRALEDPESEIPTLGDLGKALGKDLSSVTRIAKRLEAAKHIVFLNQRRIIRPEPLMNCANLAQSLDSSNGFTVREFSDACGYGRNACIDILEYLDRTGVTRRAGDRRHVIGAFKPSK